LEGQLGPRSEAHYRLPKPEQRELSKTILREWGIGNRHQWGFHYGIGDKLVACSAANYI
jgi:hypothetical protein